MSFSHQLSNWHQSRYIGKQRILTLSKHSCTVPPSTLLCLDNTCKNMRIRQFITDIIQGLQRKGNIVQISYKSLAESAFHPLIRPRSFFQLIHERYYKDNKAPFMDSIQHSGRGWYLYVFEPWNTRIEWHGATFAVSMSELANVCNVKWNFRRYSRNHVRTCHEIRSC